MKELDKHQEKLRASLHPLGDLYYDFLISLGVSPVDAYESREEVLDRNCQSRKRAAEFHILLDDLTQPKEQ